MKVPLSSYRFLLLGCILLGIFLRLYNLNWGAPFYFHPDERNIASSVSQLLFPSQMNPHFFAYGSLPIYLFFVTGMITNFFTSCHYSITNCSVSFEQAIIISRWYAAIFSIGLIPLLYYIGRKFINEQGGVLVAILATVNVGFIQFAHFGTTEMWLTFFGLLYFLFLLKLVYEPTKKVVFVLSLIGGILVSAKLSSVVLLLLLYPTLLFALLKHKASVTRALTQTIILGGMYGLLILGIFLLTNPYVIVDLPSFLGSISYESQVATGTLPVFYTQEFIGTMPIMFQYRFVLPFLLNPLLTIVSIPALLFLSYRAFQKRDVTYVLLISIFLIVFLSQAVLFVKWTRYMVPALPFFLLIIIAGGNELLKVLRLTKHQSIVYGLSLIVILTASIFGFSYMITTFGSPDTRMQAAAYAAKHFPPQGSYLSEVYDLGITPFNSSFPSTTLFNFYELDNKNPEATPEMLSTLTNESKAIILPSQRLLKTRLLYPDLYPSGHRFYSDLYNERGYTKVYETPCDIFCHITYLGKPLFAYEGTASVFDRPIVFIYAKETK